MVNRAPTVPRHRQNDVRVSTVHGSKDGEVGEYINPLVSFPQTAISASTTPAATPTTTETNTSNTHQRT